jgi:signal transduction histidine kinase/ligand-binding sensor domain-containing protein
MGKVLLAQPTRARAERRRAGDFLCGGKFSWLQAGAAITARYNFFMFASRDRALKLATLIFFLMGGGRMFAQDGEVNASWSKRVWQTDDGLPAANVTGIAQTHDGYLWLATQAGLARFDGTQFQLIHIPIGRANPLIRVMLCDHAENFWLAEDGGVVVRFGTSAPQLFSTTNGLPDALALQLVETPDQVVWLTYADGSVFEITPDNHVQRLGNADGIKDDGTCSLTLDAHGVLWFTKAFQFGFYRDHHFQELGKLPERNSQIFGARNGDIWFCSPTQLLKSSSQASPVTVASFDPALTHVRPSVLFEDLAGRLWVGTSSDGLFLLDHKNLLKIETSQNDIHAIARDREGSLWVGTDGGGLNRLLPQVVELHGRDEGLPFETVRSLSEDRAGDLWVVTQDGALTKLPRDHWSSGEKIEGLPGGSAHCVVMDHAGTMWIGSYLRGLYRWQDGKFFRFNLQNGLGGGTIRSLMVDSRNDLWIGLEGEHLVQRLHAGQFQSFKLPGNSRAVRAMAEDAAGNIWLGTLDGHLLRVDGDTLTELPQPAADSPHPIRCLSATPDGSLWIGYAVNGVGRFKAGKFSHLGREQGLFDENICALMPDAGGRMWCASDRGIFFVTLAQLNAVADGRLSRVQSVFYGRDAGLPSLQAYYGYWPGALTTRAGEILFPTHSGIAVVHPDRVHANLLPPDVLIQSVTLDGKEILPVANRPVKVPPIHRKIEITFTTPSFIAPEQDRFRYRLAGWNDDWSEVERGQPAVFSRLPPGDYDFQVTACNNFGVWNEKGADFKFTVTPFFWQRWIFRLAASLLLLAVVVLIVRHFSLRRVRQVMRRMEQQAALQEERTRIAQDMHDELGARFTQISLLGELSRNAIVEPDKAREFLGQISRVAQIGVKSLDEIVWAVNPRNDTLPDLLDYTGQYALDFVAAAGLQCRLDFPDTPPAREIPGDIRHAVFLILKETLNNVVKHAQATRVKILFDLEKDEMLWRIDDDGKGFEPAPDNALDDGLRNIRQRAAALGGHAEIKSFPGKGTRVSVRIPLKK